MILWSWFKNSFTYWSDLGQQRLLSLAEESFALDRCNGFWVKLPHSLPGQPNQTDSTQDVMETTFKG